MSPSKSSGDGEQEWGRGGQDFFGVQAVNLDAGAWVLRRLVEVAIAAWECFFFSALGL